MYVTVEAVIDPRGIAVNMRVNELQNALDLRHLNDIGYALLHFQAAVKDRMGYEDRPERIVLNGEEATDPRIRPCESR